jgi:hypothetical protein
MPKAWVGSPSNTIIVAMINYIQETNKLKLAWRLNHACIMNKLKKNHTK